MLSLLCGIGYSQKVNVRPKPKSASVSKRKIGKKREYRPKRNNQISEDLYYYPDTLAMDWDQPVDSVLPEDDYLAAINFLDEYAAYQNQETPYTSNDITTNYIYYSPATNEFVYRFTILSVVKDFDKLKSQLTGKEYIERYAAIYATCEDEIDELFLQALLETHSSILLLFSVPSSNNEISVRISPEDLRNAIDSSY